MYCSICTWISGWMKTLELLGRKMDGNAALRHWSTMLRVRNIMLRVRNTGLHGVHGREDVLRVSNVHARLKSALKVQVATRNTHVAHPQHQWSRKGNKSARGLLSLSTLCLFKEVPAAKKRSFRLSGDRIRVWSRRLHHWSTRIERFEGPKSPSQPSRHFGFHHDFFYLFLFFFVFSLHVWVVLLVLRV